MLCGAVWFEGLERLLFSEDLVVGSVCFLQKLLGLNSPKAIKINTFSLLMYRFEQIPLYIIQILIIGSTYTLS